MAETLAGNLDAVRGRIAAAARRSGRAPESVTLVGVSKTMPAERLREAIAAGLRDLGENKVQEARDKVGPVGPGARWHLVGHLQGNKANQAARIFDVVHSIDGVDLLDRLERGAQAAGRKIDALVQADLAGEATKSGAPPDAIDAILERAAGCNAVAVRGLMILPPYEEDPERSRPWFRRLRELGETLAGRHPKLALRELSMGMTGDFEVAIEEGATLVRVGRALFGERITTHAGAGARPGETS
ncbi:MAG TPA: YggS family pyridoxal phosphate-dependent enzyme [Candidatus Polarisedimenticolia bacterium]|nr:YggS family pyridoxal phosphate-dependent enzyme [Candidatus Polarisedimenticolia bacterium]